MNNKKDNGLLKIVVFGKNNFQTSTSAQPPNQAQPSQPQASTINLSEEISSKTGVRMARYINLE